MAMLPLSIPHTFVRWLTELGDVVYDPFADAAARRSRLNVLDALKRRIDVHGKVPDETLQ